MAKKNKNRPSKPIAGLADALLKAGLVDEQRAKKTLSEKNRAVRSLDRKTLAEIETEKIAATEQARLAGKEAAREREAKKLDSESLERAQRLIREHTKQGRGNKQWFFVSRDGRTPYLELSDEIMRLLTDGAAGVVESLETVTESHVVVADAQALATLSEFDPELVRFWNRSPRKG